MNILYGKGKIKDDREPVFKCGFKFIKFEQHAKPTYIDGNIQYKGKTYCFTDKIVINVRFKETDIIAETMTTITISDCDFLDMDQAITSSKIILDKDFNMYSVTDKANGVGYVSYSSYNYIEYTIDSSKNINIRHSDNVNMCYDEIIDIINEKYNTWMFDGMFKILPPFRRIDDVNDILYSRFKNKFQQLFKKNNLNLDDYYGIDCIELATIDEIIYYTRQGEQTGREFDTYPVYIMHQDGVTPVGHGLKCVTTDSDQFYYMFITDSISHSLTIKDLKKLRITTSQNLHDQLNLVVVKFNYRAIEQYKKRSIMAYLSPTI